ncbi:MAG: alpha/beta fold hydrolase [Rhodanobacter sp.]
MRYVLGSLAAVLLLAAAPIGAAEVAPQTCQDHSNALLDALARGDFANADKDFDSVVSQTLPAEKLQQVWTQIQTQAGVYQQHAAPTMKSVAGQPLVVTHVSFAAMPLDALVACDADGRISTFRLVPTQATVGPSATTTVKGVRERPLAVTSPLGPLPGTLTLPHGDGPFPAVLLLAGSGPNDRDETIGPNKPFRDVAQGLAAAGIASLRYDKRTRVYATQMAEAQKAGKALTVDDEVTDDALSALKLLAKQPAVDGKRVFVLGHSLGAMMAPRVGQRDMQLAGLVLLAAPATLDLDTVIRQMRYIGQQQGLSAAAMDEQLAPVIQARAALAKVDAAHPPDQLYFHAPASYWLSLRDYDAVEVAASLRMPMLVLQGGGDYQVTPKHDFARWQAAFPDSHRVQLKEYPSLSHLFMPAGAVPGPADFAKPAHVDAGVIRDIASWIKAQPAVGP